MPADRYLFNNISQTDKNSLLLDLAQRVKKEAVFVYPTETIYGVGGIVTSNVEEKIYSAKKRRPENPLLLISGNVDHFDSLISENPPVAKLIASKFWPGNITLVLKDFDNSTTVGVRVSDNPFIVELTNLINQPIYSTSANISGEKYKDNPDFIYSTFKNSIDFMADYGFLKKSMPSTVVMITRDNKIKILRNGSVPIELLQDYTD